MDDIDRNILVLLQTDATLPYAELGSRVGLSASSINDRLKRLKAEGAIRRIVADIDPVCLGLDLLVFMLVEIGDSVGERQFLAAMNARVEVLECHHIAGEFSYLLKLRLASTAELESFLAERVKPLAGIHRTQCLIALSSAKDSRALPVRMERKKLRMDRAEPGNRSGRR